MSPYALQWFYILFKQGFILLDVCGEQGEELGKPFRHRCFAAFPHPPQEEYHVVPTDGGLDVLDGFPREIPLGIPQEFLDCHWGDYPKRVKVDCPSPLDIKPSPMRPRQWVAILIVGVLHDAYRSSCYFQVFKDGRLSMGPVWDYDLAFGNSTLYNGFETKGWRFPLSEAKGQSYIPAPKWWSSLYANPMFKLAMKKRWSHLRQSIFADSFIESIVDSLANPIKPALEKNFNKWAVIGKPILWTNAPQVSYEAEIIYLKRWMSERAHWMDLELSKAQ